LAVYGIRIYWKFGIYALFCFVWNNAYLLFYKGLLVVCSVWYGVNVMEI